MVSVVIYYIFMETLTENLLLNSLYAVPPIWIIGTYFYYQRSVKQQY